MSLQKAYGSAVAHQLRFHAVWHPVDPVSLGDYGIMSAGVFKKLGSLREFDIAVDEETTMPSFCEYSSKGVSTRRLSASAEAPTLGAAPIADMSAALEIRFGSEYSLLNGCDRVDVAAKVYR